MDIPYVLVVTTSVDDLDPHTVYFIRVPNLLCMYCIQQCFICRPFRFHCVGASEDAGIKPGTVATLALAVRRSNHSAKSHPFKAGWKNRRLPILRGLDPNPIMKIHDYGFVSWLGSLHCYDVDLVGFWFDPLEGSGMDPAYSFWSLFNPCLWLTDPDLGGQKHTVWIGIRNTASLTFFIRIALRVESLACSHCTGKMDQYMYDGG
jgi:hypothetical protein